MKPQSALTGMVTIALALSLALPATARPTPSRSAHVWRDIEQLDRDIARADTRDTISEREAAGLREEVRELRAQYRRLNVGGLSPAEARTLEDRVHRLRARLGNERHDPDHHQG